MNLLTGEFDYSLLDENTASSLQEKEYILVGIHRRYSTEVGKTFYEAQSELAGSNQYDGVFEKWFTKLGFKKQNVYNYINIYKQVQNLDEHQLEIFDKQSKSLQTEMSKPSAIPEVNQAVYNGEITSHKAYKEMEKEIRQKDAEIEELKSREHEVIEKEIVKEVPVKPHDYDGLKSDINQLSQELKEQQAENRKMRNQINQWEDEKGEIDKKSKRYDELSQAIEEMEGRLNEKQKRIAAVKDITSKLKTGNQLIDELSGLIYLADYDELSRNDFLSDELNKMVYRLNEFIGDLSKRLEQKTILEGEIVND